MSSSDKRTQKTFSFFFNIASTSNLVIKIVGSSTTLTGSPFNSRKYIDICSRSSLHGLYCRLNSWHRRFALIHIKIRKNMKNLLLRLSHSSKADRRCARTSFRCCNCGWDVASVRLEVLASASSATRPLLPLDISMEMLYQRASLSLGVAF